MFRDPTHKALIQAARREYRHVAKKLFDKAKAQGIANGMSEEQADGIAKANVAQNVIRAAMEACLAEMVPFDTGLLGELAVRIASYMISAAPLEDQDFIVASFVRSFADAHQERTARGIFLQTEWGRTPDGADRRANDGGH